MKIVFSSGIEDGEINRFMCFLYFYREFTEFLVSIIDLPPIHSSPLPSQAYSTVFINYW